MLNQRLTFDGEDRNARFGNRRRGVILGGKDVAGCPTHIRAKCDKRLDQNGGLDGHVQGADDPRAFQRLALTVFVTQRHQARHLGFGDVQLFAPVGRQIDILNNIVVGHAALLFEVLQGG